MRVHWTQAALRHLLAIHEHIARDSGVYALRMVDRLTRRAEQLARFPLLGRRVPEYEEPDIREVIEKPYRIIYRVKADQVDVLAVMHGARLLPPADPDAESSPAR